MGKMQTLPALALLMVAAHPLGAETQGKPPAPQNVQLAPPPGPAMVADELATLRHQHEKDKKKIQELAKAIEDGGKALADCQKARDAAQKKADVRFFCLGYETSKNSLGASESCVPFRCNAVSGLCNKRCATAADCASGFACDWNTGSCTR